jgi:3-oxoacyl-(acyl-carrier-protein) synthase
LSGKEDTLDPTRRATLVGGHNLNERYFTTNYEVFLDEPDYIDPMAALSMLDTDHAGTVSEVLGCTSTSDGSHLPAPSTEGQARTVERLLRRCGIKPEQVDYVSAHATSTPLGDLSEIKALKAVFGDHAYKLKVNAPKSMLGHTCWSAPAVETVAALMQMKHGKLHPSINIEAMDPAIDLDVCANVAVDHQIEIMLKNSFGFGGLNCCSLFRRFDKASL